MDPAAPFLHEFWYQAMVNDVLKVDDGTQYQCDDSCFDLLHIY